MTEALQIVERATAGLVPYARNARQHPEEQVAQIAASIAEFGFVNPVLIDAAGGIIAGHGRHLAAVKLGLETVPTIELPHLDEAQRRALILADNRIAENAGWDADVLRLELADLSELGVGLEGLGFATTEINNLFAEVPEADAREEAVPEVPETPISRPGDLWCLGKHRLLCGDSTDADGVARLLAGAKPVVMVTDPPYGVEYDPEWRVGKLNATGALGKVENDDKVDWSGALALFPGNVAYVWHAGFYAGEVAASLFGLGFEIRAQVIWKKQHFVISRGAYHWAHEPCWYAVRKGKTANWKGNRKQSTVWEVQNACAMGGNAEDGKTVHSTQKPVEVMRRPIMNHTRPGDAVYEPFMGSGTTIIAAESSRRACFGLEINPAYVDVAVRRWEKFSGAVATLDADGATFTAVGERRAREN